MWKQSEVHRTLSHELCISDKFQRDIICKAWWAGDASTKLEGAKSPNRAEKNVRAKDPARENQKTSICVSNDCGCILNFAPIAHNFCSNPCEKKWKEY
jgi:hypothetical protein